jgi:hypothetical protein
MPVVILLLGGVLAIVVHGKRVCGKKRRCASKWLLVRSESHLCELPIFRPGGVSSLSKGIGDSASAEEIQRENPPHRKTNLVGLHRSITTSHVGCEQQMRRLPSAG